MKPGETVVNELRALRHAIDQIGVGLRTSLATVGVNPNGLKPATSEGFASAFTVAEDRIHRDAADHMAEIEPLLADIRQWIGENISAVDVILVDVGLLMFAEEPLHNMASACRETLPEIAEYLGERILWLKTEGWPQKWDEMRKREGH